jgi:hypothetical protein
MRSVSALELDRGARVRKSRLDPEIGILATHLAARNMRALPPWRRNRVRGDDSILYRGRPGGSKTARRRDLSLIAVATWITRIGEPESLRVASRSQTPRIEQGGQPARLGRGRRRNAPALRNEMPTAEAGVRRNKTNGGRVSGEPPVHSDPNALLATMQPRQAHQFSMRSPLLLPLGRFGRSTAEDHIDRLAVLGLRVIIRDSWYERCAGSGRWAASSGTSDGQRRAEERPQARSRQSASARSQARATAARRRASPAKARRR